MTWRNNAVAIAMTGLLLGAGAVPARADAAAEVKAVQDAFSKAVTAKDLDGIMKYYVPDENLVVFDVVPPRQYVGAAAYRKDWKEFLDSIDGPLSFETTEYAVSADTNLAFAHSIQRVSGKTKNGGNFDLTTRVTDVFKKIDGKWLVVHEHLSVPVDLGTGTPDLSSKP
jgi:ketosteroid isomerase-like protein